MIYQVKGRLISKDKDFVVLEGGGIGLKISSTLNTIRGINKDGDEYIQSSKINNHINVAKELLKNGSAYKCYCSIEEIQEQKKKSKFNLLN